VFSTLLCILSSDQSWGSPVLFLGEHEFIS
jgi:hypothetical protein